MKNLLLVLVLAASCGGSDSKATPDAPPMMPDAGPDCFEGTPKMHDDLINACVNQTVTRIIKYPTLAAELAALPRLNPDGSIPPPP
ncbi:MAG: hypothetical protein E6J90_35825 [Deltaproteobacteria bacterium]|nr:MAG: hypothetical protein E6J91_30255 [Deltaproteobacteria bacterium]TMQ10801.1 MAG: hypothetical protein E6J90_35825 [Deltaproteobacteria bacterium]